MVIVIMGVSGCGKSTVGSALAARLGVPFHDADDFHPPANVDKMRAGLPLTDADREPWLRRLAALLGDLRGGGVLACSALKHQYRVSLREGGDVRWVYLAGDKALIRERLASREDHYMGPDLLDSQFDALEVPDDATCVNVDRPVDEIVAELLETLRYDESF